MGFTDKVRVLPSGCWEWTGATTKGGYGVFKPPGERTQLAHRWSYATHVGPIPDGLTLDHTCHSHECPGGPACPHRRCVNPEHLEPVANRVNLARGRGRWPKNPDRDAEIMRLHRAGLSNRKIAPLVGMSHEGVRAIVAHARP